MARILYGVHGTGHGHAMRALTIARRLRSHDFLFVAADDAPSVLEGEFPVRRIPNLAIIRARCCALSRSSSPTSA